MHIRQAQGPDDIEIVRGLLLEYADSLQVDLGFQHFAEELATLPGMYAPPRGRLLLAQASNDSVVGCVGLRPLEGTLGEMKRLYVRPAYRGQGVGKRLTLAVVEAARQIGYCRIRLDTLASMTDAIRLYERLGCYEIPAYCANPIPGARFLEMKLRDPSP